GSPPRVLSVRRGARGSYLWTNKRPGQYWTIPPAQGVHVIDPTGAGNAFCGALAANMPRLDGVRGEGAHREWEWALWQQGMLRAASRASATGAAVVAVEGLPNVGEDIRKAMVAESLRIYGSIPMPEPC
ncbi:unnamed protein product, partial [Discosporangium mesarthrocarpum]